MRELPAPARFRLLPPNTDLGWTPYAWLIYAPTFLVQPIVDHAGAGMWALTIAGLAVFLVAYFRGFWLCGRDVWPVIGILSLMAFAYTPINTGASILFVYSASFAARLEDSRTAFRLVGAITILGLLTSLLFDVPPYYLITVAVFTPLIGAVNIHFAQVGLTNRALRVAREQIEHLATVAERERIARDLHDVLGHTLSLIVLKSELASKLADRDPARAIAEIRDVERVARDVLHEVREAIHGLRPSYSDEVASARAMLDAAGVRAEFDGPALELPRGAEETLALALREAVTNIVRHAGANSCRISLRATGSRYELVITDDGRGGVAPDGNGLQGMRARVEAFGGSIERTGTGGTSLMIAVPASP